MKHDDTRGPTLAEQIDEIPGWFAWFDRMIFRGLLGQDVPGGDVVELGTYLGKSAAWIGGFLKPDDRFTVLDLFAGDDDQRETTSGGFRSLTQQSFEANYLKVHPTLPRVVSDYSTAIVDHVPAGSVRFLHIDASHAYDDVVADIASARVLLRDNGVIAFDDYRTLHAPDVAAAVWPEIVAGRLKVICCTPNKLYATPGDPTSAIELVGQLVAARTGRLQRVDRVVAGQPVMVVRPRPKSQVAE